MHLPPSQLPNSDTTAPYVFVGDEAVAYRGGGVVWGVQIPLRNSEILKKYQKLRKFYYMK
jgi:hypothetical protein